MSIKKMLGKKIKNMRVKKGFTQEKLAELIGVSQRTLSGIEIGENFLTAETLEKIIKVLGTSLDEMFKVEHLKSTDELVKEIIFDIRSISGDEKKLQTVYKVLKALIND